MAFKEIPYDNFIKFSEQVQQNLLAAGTMPMKDGKAMLPDETVLAAMAAKAARNGAPATAATPAPAPAEPPATAATPAPAPAEPPATAATPAPKASRKKAASAPEAPVTTTEAPASAPEAPPSETAVDVQAHARALGSSVAGLFLSTNGLGIRVSLTLGN